MTTAYDLLTAHYDKYKYKRGAYVGYAPLDPSRRRKTNQRVTSSPLQAEVVCHNTTILRAMPDGSVHLNTSSWRTNLTKDALNQALATIKLPTRIYSCKRFGLSQWHLYVPGHGQYAFYDGMHLNQHGTPRRPHPFMRRCIDVTQSRPFAKQAREFTQMFPVLHAGVPDTRDNVTSVDISQLYYKHKLYDARALALAVTTQPELWPIIAAAYSYPNLYVTWQQRKLPAKDALRHIMNKAKEPMYHTIETTTTHIAA